MADKNDAPKDEWDDLIKEIDSEKSAQKRRAAVNAAADDILKAAEKADKAEAKADSEDGSNEDEAPDAGAAAVARIEELELELATLKDQALRAMADAENVKRRSEKEVTAARIFGIERFANDILSVHDNLSRALQTLEGTDKSELGENAKNLVEGIELTEKDLMAVLELSQIFRQMKIRAMSRPSCNPVLKLETAPYAPPWSPSAQVKLNS